MAVSRKQLDARLRQLLLGPQSQESMKEILHILLALDKLEAEPRTRRQQELFELRKQLLALWENLERLGTTPEALRIRAEMQPKLEVELSKLAQKMTRPRTPRLIKILPGHTVFEKAVAYHALGTVGTIATNGLHDEVTCSENDHVLTLVIPISETNPLHATTPGVGLCACHKNATLNYQRIIWEGPEDVAAQLGLPTLPVSQAIPISKLEWHAPCKGANHVLALVIPVDEKSALRKMTSGIGICACGARAAVNYAQPSWASPDKVARRLGLPRLPVELAVPLDTHHNQRPSGHNDNCDHGHDAWMYILEHVGPNYDESHIVHTCSCEQYARIDIDDKRSRVGVIERRLNVRLDSIMREPVLQKQEVAA